MELATYFVHWICKQTRKYQAVKSVKAIIMLHIAAVRVSLAFYLILSQRLCGWKVKSALLISSQACWPQPGLAYFSSGQWELATNGRRKKGLGQTSEWSAGDGETAVVGGMVAVVNRSTKKLPRRFQTDRRDLHRPVVPVFSVPEMFLRNLALCFTSVSSAPPLSSIWNFLLSPAHPADAVAIYKKSRRH